MITALSKRRKMALQAICAVILFASFFSDMRSSKLFSSSYLGHFGGGAVWYERLPVNINTATASELSGLKGIGPGLSRRIVEYREVHGPFILPSDIKNVKGVGEKKFLAIKDNIRTGFEQ